MKDAIRNVALIVNCSNEDEKLFRFAARFAKSHGAHLSAIHVLPPFPNYSSIGVAYLLPDTLADQYRESKISHDDEIRDRFTAITNSEDVAGNWLRIEGDPLTRTCERARYFDLTIAQQPDPDAPPGGIAIINRLVLHSPLRQDSCTIFPE